MPRVESQYDGYSVDARVVADIIELRFGPQPDADVFADLICDPQTGKVSVPELVTRLYSCWKKGRSGAAELTK